MQVYNCNKLNIHGCDMYWLQYRAYSMLIIIFQLTILTEVSVCLFEKKICFNFFSSVNKSKIIKLVVLTSLIDVGRLLFHTDIPLNFHFVNVGE